MANKSKSKTGDLVSAKLPRWFVKWLKIEAAKASVPLYQIVVDRFPEAKSR